MQTIPRCADGAATCSTQSGSKKANSQRVASSGKSETGKKTAVTIAAFFIIVCVWVLLDQFTKSLFSGMQPAGVLAGPFAGLIDIRLVHNTGGAWGICSGNTTALGVNIETSPTHIAGMPVAVNICCHAARHASVEI